MILLLALVVIALAVMLVVLFNRVRGMQQAYETLIASEDGGAAAAADHRFQRQLDHAQERLNTAAAEMEDLRAQLVRSVQGIGFTRYDAFDEMAGQLSYSLALVTPAGDGVVVSAINGRTDSRTYAKVLHGGASPQPMSDEERAALTDAVAALTAPVKPRLDDSGGGTTRD